MKNTFWIVALVAGLGMSGCRQGESLPDAYGNFEAGEITVSAEAQGRILAFDLAEGEIVKSGKLLGWIDTTDLSLKRLQMRHQKAALLAKFSSLEAQSAVYEQQKINLDKDRVRISNMLKEGAATRKQLDDVESGIMLAIRQSEAVTAQYASLKAEVAALDEQIRQVDEGLNRCRIMSPVEGTVLVKYLMQGEMASPGKPMFRIADLSELTLRAYVSGSQLHRVVAGKAAQVSVDAGEGGLKTYQGTIAWISGEAEFTPKIIQTREERVNLVYAVKITVKNDGSLKIGMP